MLRDKALTAGAWTFRSVVKPTHLRLRELSSVLIDWRLGVRTTDEFVAAALAVEIGHFRQTQRALGWAGVWRILHHIRPSVHDVLLDVGCGAGRVACGAARAGFGRVIGIDLDPHVLDLARANAASLRNARCPIEVKHADATTYVVEDDVTVVFLYNPFNGAILRAAIGRIVESIDRSPRFVRIVYANPTEPEMIVATGLFAKTSQLYLGWRPGTEWLRSFAVDVYSTTLTGCDSK